MLDKQLATTYILTQWVKKYEKITLLGKTANYCLHRAKKSNQKSPDSNENLKRKINLLCTLIFHLLPIVHW